MTVRRIQDDENVHRLRLLQQEVQMALPVRSQPVAVRQLIGGAEVFHSTLINLSRSGGRESAPRPDDVRSDALRHELAKMELDEVADVAARNESPAHGYAARVEMDRRVAQAQIIAATAQRDAATAQRDAANVQKMTLWAVFLLIPAALLSVVIGWLLAKILGVA